MASPTLKKKTFKPYNHSLVCLTHLSTPGIYQKLLPLRVDSFPMAALTNDYKPGDWKEITLSMECNSGGEECKTQGDGRVTPSELE